MSDTSETVTLSRAEYEALIERAEEAEDLATVAAAEAREAALGKEKARADYLPVELVRRLSAGEHPVRVWRAHRGLTREPLASAAGIAPSYLSEIETRRKPGSFGALAKISAALSISLDDLAAWLAPHQERGVGHSITSSARARIDGGTVRPSALAVLRLMASSKVVGCWTGRSAGLAPLRILPAYMPA